MSKQAASLSEDEAAEVQVAMITYARNLKTAKQVWTALECNFPEFSSQQIRDACKPLLLRMIQE